MRIQPGSSNQELRQLLQGQAGLRGELERVRELNQRITDEAAQLTRALKDDRKLQGSWGEQKLELLLEMAGLRRSVAYERELAALAGRIHDKLQVFLERMENARLPVAMERASRGKGSQDRL